MQTLSALSADLKLEPLVIMFSLTPACHITSAKTDYHVIKYIKTYVLMHYAHKLHIF